MPSISSYINSKHYSRQEDQEIQQFLSEHQITTKGSNIPNPFLNFKCMKLPDFIQRTIEKENYTAPTPIQAQTWPIAMNGRNMVGVAQTGSGKTFGFLLPAILHLLNGGRCREPRVLVLSPTRELAQQTQQVAVKFGGREVRSVCVYGGARKYDQKSELRRGADIIIATPGRLNDFLESKIISLQQCSFLVLDEADRMLDMGFEPQVRKIINSIPESSCQTLMFSATWPKEVRNLAEEFLGSYDQVNIGSVSSNPTANHSIHQVIEMCDDHGKIDKLFQYLADIMKEDERKTIIFTQTKKNVDYLTREIRKERYEVSGIHGDKTQQERDYILRSFTTGRIQVMVATDVASRGLDVDDIKYVINFDFPSSIEEYVHRIGRTGRRGREGTSISFFTKSDGRFAKDLVAIMKECNQEVDKKLEAMSYQHHGGGGNSRYGNRWGGGGGYRRNGYGGGGNKSYGGGKSNGSSWGSSSNNSSWGNKSNSSYKKY